MVCMLTRRRNYTISFVDLSHSPSALTAITEIANCRCCTHSYDEISMRVIHGLQGKLDEWHLSQYGQPHRPSHSTLSLSTLFERLRRDVKNSYRSKRSSMIAIDCFWFVCVESSAINLNVFAFIHIESAHFAKWFCSSFSVLSAVFSPPRSFSLIRTIFWHKTKGLLQSHCPKFLLIVTFTVLWPISLKRWSHARKTNHTIQILSENWFISNGICFDGQYTIRQQN